MCYDSPYDETDDEGNSYMRIAVSDEKIIKQITVGESTQFSVSGTVEEVIAPKMVRDYSVDYDYKKGTKKPMKKRPGHVKLKLNKGDPDIHILNAHLRDEEG